MISGPSGETNDGRKTDKVGGYDTTQLWRPRLSQAVDRRGKAVQAEEVTFLEAEETDVCLIMLNAWTARSP